MTDIIAIYGKTCSEKTDVARELSRMTGFKVKHPGEAATTYAKAGKLPTASDVPDETHRTIDEDAKTWATAGTEELIIMESEFMDEVLKNIDGVFFIRLHADDATRQKRWEHRKEEGGGRTRLLGESVSQRDELDHQLRLRLYGSESSIKPNMEIDTSGRGYEACAHEIWGAFQEAAGVVTMAGKPAMDKSQKKGISPGPAAGTVKSYNEKRNPFGGYIVDDESGRDIFVHKSAIDESSMSRLERGQRVKFDIIEDGFGGFKAVKISAV